MAWDRKVWNKISTWPGSIISKRNARREMISSRMVVMELKQLVSICWKLEFYLMLSWEFSSDSKLSKHTRLNEF